MRDICLPLKDVENDKPVEVIVNVNGEKRKSKNMTKTGRLSRYLIPAKTQKQSRPYSG